MNQQILIGNVGGEVNLTYTSGGRAKAVFSVASNESYTDKNKQKHEKTTWFRVVCWGKVAEVASKFLTKGRQVYISGRTDNRSYEDSTTKETKYISEVIADRVTFLGAKPTTSNTENKAGAPDSVSSEGEGEEVPATQTQDDIPF